MAADTAAAGAALPDLAWRFGDPSTLDGAGPTDCDRSTLARMNEKRKNTKIVIFF